MSSGSSPKLKNAWQKFVHEHIPDGAAHDIGLKPGLLKPGNDASGIGGNGKISSHLHLPSLREITVSTQAMAGSGAG